MTRYFTLGTAMTVLLAAGSARAEKPEREAGGRVHVAFSPDGIQWSKLHDAKISTAADTHNNAFWDPLAGEYVGISRGWSKGKMGYDLKDDPHPWGGKGGWVGGERIVVRAESKDFDKWSAPEEILRGHGNGQTYAVPAFFCEGLYLGLPVILHGRMHPELAWSPDTEKWHWIDQGEALIPLSEDRDSIEWGCIFAADAPVAWRDGFELTAWKDRPIRLVFNIKQAKLYAFSFQQERPVINSNK